MGVAVSGAALLVLLYVSAVSSAAFVKKPVDFCPNA
jgi:hypothetical protein